MSSGSKWNSVRKKTRRKFATIDYELARDKKKQAKKNRKHRKRDD